YLRYSPVPAPGHHATYALSLHDALPISTSGEPAFGPLRPVETAPSATIAELPTVARMAGMVGLFALVLGAAVVISTKAVGPRWRSEEHTSELQSLRQLECRIPPAKT